MVSLISHCRACVVRRGPFRARVCAFMRTTAAPFSPFFSLFVLGWLRSLFVSGRCLFPVGEGEGRRGGRRDRRVGTSWGVVCLREAVRDSAGSCWGSEFGRLSGRACGVFRDGSRFCIFSLFTFFYVCVCVLARCVSVTRWIDIEEL